MDIIERSYIPADLRTANSKAMKSLEHKIKYASLT